MFNNYNLLIYYISIIYLLPMTMLTLILINSDTHNLQTLFSYKKKSFLQFFLLLFILNLAGIPPLPGFFIKLNFYILILSKTNSILISFLTILFNFLTFYFYIKNLVFISYIKNIKILKYNKKLNIFIFILILFYLLFIIVWPVNFFLTLIFS